MASIIPGYEYDIFISYRQKDNKGERWVSVFVDALKTELESTFKEEISVYFDINTHDGLLETHDVDASLKDKLKCVVFIPIISRTYCDPNSFAWNHEFKPFVEFASNDLLGLKVKLPGGNVANRLLPVQIHDLYAEDKKLIEVELGGYLRGIEFIYKEPGVNRPLMSNEDHPDNNLNKTFYRNQINKVANAINEIIDGMRSVEHSGNGISKKIDEEKAAAPKKLKPKIIITALTALILIFLGYFFIPKLFKSSESVDKSIAVLPFENMTNNAEQEYFSDGMMEEILNHLFKIGGLNIPSGTSSMRYKGSHLSVREIARELSVTYVLEGNVSRSGDSVRIIVRLINGKNEQLLWTQDYRRGMTAINLFEIQGDIARQVADNMRVFINPEVKKRIEARPTINTEAYTLFLRVINQYPANDQAITLLERAISLDPEYADAYADLGILWLYRGGHGGDLNREQVLEKAEPLINKALELDKNCLLAHTAKAALSLYYYWDFKSVEKEFQIFKKLNPSNTDLKGYFSDYLLASGNFHEALAFTENSFNQNKNSFSNWVQLALTYYFNDLQQKALETLDSTRQIFPNNDYVFLNSIRLLVYMAKYNEAVTFFEKNIPDKKPGNLIPYFLGHMGVAYFETGNKSKSEEYLNELLARRKKSAVGSPSFFTAAIYTAEGENDKAIQTLEKGYSDHEVEMYWLKVDPLFRLLHGDQRFENLLIKMRLK